MRPSQPFSFEGAIVDLNLSEAQESSRGLHLRPLPRPPRSTGGQRMSTVKRKFTQGRKKSFFSEKLIHTLFRCLPTQKVELISTGFFCKNQNSRTNKILGNLLESILGNSVDSRLANSGIAQARDKNHIRLTVCLKVCIYAVQFLHARLGYLRISFPVCQAR